MRIKHIVTLVLMGAGANAHAALVMSSVSYSAYANITDTNNTLLVSNGNNGNAPTGGSVAGTIAGTRSDYNVTTQHQGDATFNMSASPAGLSGNGSARSKTTYLSGGNSFLGQQTVSGMGSTVNFTVDSTQQYVASLTGIVDAFHRAYDPFGPAGSFFNYLRLYSSVEGYLFNSQSLNSATLANIPFSQVVTLHPGASYSLEFEAASTGVTVNFASADAGAGAYGETAYTIGYSLTPVPEPGTISAVALSLAALRRVRRKTMC